MSDDLIERAKTRAYATVPLADYGWQNLVSELVVALEAARKRIAELEETQRKFGAVQHELFNRAERAEAELEAARKRIAELEHPTAMDEAIAAGEGTLHGAIDYWQGRAERAEQRIAELEAKNANWADTCRRWERDCNELQAELAAVRLRLAQVAAIAHNGGLVGLDQDRALSAIRRATLVDFDRCETPEQAAQSVRAAIDAARSKDSEQVGAGTGS